MNKSSMEIGIEPIRKEVLKVGDVAYIIESNRIIRQVTIIKKYHSFCTVKFADSDGAINVRGGRLYGTRNEAETRLNKSKPANTRIEGPRPPHRTW